MKTETATLKWEQVLQIKLLQMYWQDSRLSIILWTAMWKTMLSLSCDGDIVMFNHVYSSVLKHEQVGLSLPGVIQNLWLGVLGSMLNSKAIRKCSLCLCASVVTGYGVLDDSCWPSACSRYQTQPQLWESNTCEMSAVSFINLGYQWT